MEKLNTKCKQLKNQFDFVEPNIGHFNRFEKMLKNNKKNKKFQFKYIAVAAAIIIVFGFAFVSFNTTNGVQLAEISPKMKETQDYFSWVIYEELAKIKKVETQENKTIINDAFKQIKQLENNYIKLTIELKQNNNSKQIVFAMINNYQQRITVLQNLLSNLENFKQLKNTKNENNII